MDDKYAVESKLFPDAILLYGFARHYYAYGQNARLICKELDLPMTMLAHMPESSAMPEISFYDEMLDSYASQLVDKGYPVAVSDVISEPAGTTARKMVRKTELYEPKTKAIEPDHAISDLQAELLAWKSKAQDSEQLAINVIKALGTVNIERDNFIDYAEAVARTVKAQAKELTDLKQREEVKALAAQGTPRIETRVLHKPHSFPVIADDLTAALNSGWRVAFETFVVNAASYTHIVRLEREVIDPVPAPKQEIAVSQLWQVALDELPDSQPIVPIKQLVSVEAMLTAGEVGRS